MADGCPNESLRGVLGSTQLPDCRAYEMVTPPYKEGSITFDHTIAAGGSALTGESSGIFAGAESGQGGEVGESGTQYAFTRTPTGWLTEPLGPSNAVFPANGLLDQSTGLDRSLWRLRTSSQPEGEGELYVREPGGTFQPLGPLQPPGEVARFGEEFRYNGASQDLSHVLISKRPEMGLWPGDTTAEKFSLYEYSGLDQTEPKLVGVSNPGPLASNLEAHLISQCGTNLGSEGDRDNAISADGSTVFFTALACEEAPLVNELYARIGQARTVAISEPVLPAGESCTGVCGSAEHREGIFQGASEDGTRVFFTTEQPLLDGDLDTSNDLYEAQLDSSGLRQLILVSGGGTGDPTPGTSAEVLGVARISEDGSHVYFVAKAVLTDLPNADGEYAEAGAANMYVFEEGTRHTAFVAKLSESDEALWQQSDNGRPVETTPDGNHLVFLSAAHLTGAGGGPQLYEYDAQTDEVSDLSIGQQSLTSPPRIVSPDYEVLDSPATHGSTLSLSDDGSFVFFTSTERLVAQATAGATNVYEYHDGQISLISDGQDTSAEVLLLGTDALGSDVFFTTVDPLVPSDADTQQDIYDARIDGGFTPPTPPPLGCSEDTCQGPLGASLPGALAASTTLVPEALPPATPTKPTKPAKQKAKAKHKAKPKPSKRRKTKKHKTKARRGKAKRAKAKGGNRHRSRPSTNRATR